MTPTLTPWPPPSPPRVPTPAAPAPRSGPDDRRVPAAAWVAAVGAVLVLAAASVLVVGNWNDIRPEIKLAGLAAANVVVAALAVLLRPYLPVVSRVLAHLAAAMAVPSGVAVLAAAGRPWPEAVLAGGALGAVACTAQSRRWSAPLLVPAAEAAGVLGLAGAAALTGAPLGVLVALAAVAALVARHEAGALRLATLAPAVPLLAVLGALGVGPGTADRLGARGDVLGWAAPAAGLVAACAFGVVAQRRKAVPLTVAALLATLAGVATGLAEARPDRIVLLGLAGAALVLAAALEERTTGVWAPLARSVGLGGRWVALLAAPLGLGVAVAAGASNPTDATLGLAAAAWAAGAAAFAFTRPDGSTRAVVPPAAALRVAAVLAVGGAAAAFAGGAAGGLVVAAALAAVIGATVRPSAAERVTLAVALAPLAWATAPAGATAWVVLGAVAVAAAALVATVPGGSTSAAAASTVGAVALAAGLAVGPVWPSSTWAAVVGWGTVTGVVVVGRRWLLAAGAAPWLALLVAVALDVGAGTTTTAALVAAVALTALALTRPAPGPLGVAALTTGVVGLVASTGYPSGALTSAAGVVLGVQGWLAGERYRRRALVVAGRIVALASLATLPSTTGLTARVLDALAPHGVEPMDLTVLLVATAFLGGGCWLRRSDRAARVGSWPAYAPGLLVGGLHLVTTQAASGDLWRATVAIGVGVVAVALGGVRRLGAPLVLGTLLIASSAVVAGGARLAELPVWLWLAVGGVALLAVAVLIERGGPAEEDTGAADRLRAVWHRFD